MATQTTTRSLPRVEGELARTLGRSHTTIAREIGRCGGRRRYRAHVAERETFRRSRRPRPTKLELCPELRDLVAERLRKDHSPQRRDRPRADARRQGVVH